MVVAMASAWWIQLSTRFEFWSHGHLGTFFWFESIFAPNQNVTLKIVAKSWTGGDFIVSHIKNNHPEILGKDD